jgi:hypothetical protein
MRVFQIECKIEVVVQGDRSIQKYAIDLERLLADYDYSPVACRKDPECKRGERDAQRIGGARRLQVPNSVMQHKACLLFSFFFIWQFFFQFSCKFPRKYHVQ